MNEKPFFGIQSVRRDTLDAVVLQNGRVPDLFIDSMNEAPFIPLPGTGSLMEQIEVAVDKLVEEVKEQRGTGEEPAPTGAV